MAGAIKLDSGILLREAAYDVGSSLPSHVHAWAYVSLVLHGVVTESCEGRTETRGAGSVRIMPPGVPHANAYPRRGARSLIVQLDTNAASPSRDTAVLARVSSHAPDSAVSMLARQVYGEFRAPDDLSPLAIEALLQSFFVASARAVRLRGADGIRDERAIPPWLERVRASLHDEFPRSPSLSQLAADAGVHPGHVSRAFRRAFHLSPAEYVARLRIERARQLLLGGAEPISRIACAVGFSDQAHLTRRFRALEGVTPGEFRRLAGVQEARRGRH